MIEIALDSMPGTQRLVAARRSIHQQLVDALLYGAGEIPPPLPTKPENPALLARRILEEALETINGLGVMVSIKGVASLPMEVGQEFDTVINVPYEPNSRFLTSDGYKLELIQVEDEDAVEDEDPADQVEPPDVEVIWTDGDLEFVHQDGTGPLYAGGDYVPGKFLKRDKGWVAGYSFACVEEVDLVEVVDGCLDLRSSATAVLSGCGVADEALQQEVDYNNLLKLGPGHTFDSDGKLVKPPNHPKPRIKELLEAQTET